MDDELTGLIERPEGHRLDFKRSEKLEDDSGLAKHLVAFANRYGGQLLFGVTNDKELEGASIREENLASLRRVSRVRCNPPVRFEERLYQDQNWEGQSGDVLVVDIQPKAASPHAVVEGDNNANRTYYIRTADESRLIKDSEELRHLFVSTVDPSFTKSFTTTVVHESLKYEYIRLSPGLSGWQDYRGFFSRLTTKDRSTLKESEITESEEGENVSKMTPSGEEDLGSRIIREVFPEVLFHSFDRRRPDFWIRNEVANESEYQAFRQYTEELSQAHLEILDEKTSFSKLELDLDQVFLDEGPVLVVPNGTDVIAECPESPEEPAVLRFEMDNQLTIEVSLFHNGLPTVVGPPLQFPGSIPDDTAPYTRTFVLQISADFGFPDIEDPWVRLHDTFARGLLDFIRDRWDMELYQEDLPPHELYRIGEQVDKIEDIISNQDNG